MRFDFITLQKSFFDSEHVMRKADAMQRKTLSKFGAFVRQRARSSIKRRKAISNPGSPPSSHTQSGSGTFLDGIKSIFFAYDSSRRTVVVGPVAFNGGRGIVPGLLERGGTVTRREGFGRRNRKGPSRTLHYRARPFMQPAMEAELPKFSGLLKGAFN